MASFSEQFATIETQRPWLVPFLPIHLSFKKTCTDTPLYQWLNAYFAQQDIHLASRKGDVLSFTHQNDLEHGTAYEWHIGAYHKIPTRDNLHDWFGACVWSVFPNTKALLNAKHLANLDDNDSNNKRNRVRDTITVFDENGVILVVSDDEVGDTIAHALQNFDWQTCLVDYRNCWAGGQACIKAQTFLFGHALLEQLVTPRKPICGHTIIIKMPQAFFALPLHDKLSLLDKKLCEQLDELLVDGVTPRRFNPLPILGVPFYWQSQDQAFYDDTFVFRKGRKNVN